MTLNEIIASALSELGRGHDAKSVERYRDKFMRYANDAVTDLALSLGLVRMDKVNLSGSTADLKKLCRECMKLTSVTQDGMPVRYLYSEASQIVSVRAKGQVEVYYRYIPKKLFSPSDVPDVPEYLHGLIVMYVTGRERMSGDTSTQKGADSYLSLYEIEKNRIKLSMEHGGTIENKW